MGKKVQVNLEFTAQEYYLLKQIVSNEVKFAENQPKPRITISNGRFHKVRRKYGVKGLTTLYELKKKIIVKKN